MRILIADDDAISRRMLEWLVIRCGDEPISVDTGSTAVWLLEQDDAPRIAILDWMMPDLDGIKICESLRRRTDSPYIYVFLVTSRAQKYDLIRGLRAGADDYITKPFDSDELMLRLNVAKRITDRQERLLLRIEELQTKAKSRLASPQSRD